MSSFLVIRICIVSCDASQTMRPQLAVVSLVWTEADKIPFTSFFSFFLPLLTAFYSFVFHLILIIQYLKNIWIITCSIESHKHSLHPYFDNLAFCQTTTGVDKARLLTACVTYCMISTISHNTPFSAPWEWLPKYDLYCQFFLKIV